MRKPLLGFSIEMDGTKHELPDVLKDEELEALYEDIAGIIMNVYEKLPADEYRDLRQRLSGSIVAMTIGFKLVPKPEGEKTENVIPFQVGQKLNG